MTIDHKFSAVAALKQDKAQPFGAHFSTRLNGVNSKLTCALSAAPIGGCDSGNGDDPAYHGMPMPWPEPFPSPEFPTA